MVSDKAYHLVVEKAMQPEIIEGSTVYSRLPRLFQNLEEFGIQQGYIRKNQVRAQLVPIEASVPPKAVLKQAIINEHPSEPTPDVTFRTKQSI